MRWGLLMILWTFVTVTAQHLLNTLPVFGEPATLWALLPCVETHSRGQELTFSASFVTGVQMWSGLHQAKGRPCMKSIHSGEDGGGRPRSQKLQWQRCYLGDPMTCIGGTCWQRLVATAFPWSIWQWSEAFFLLLGHPTWFSGPAGVSVSYQISFNVKFLFHLN